jgi:multiple sugar transport system substrate-binding protein
MNLTHSRQARRAIGIGVALAASMALSLGAGSAYAASTAQTDTGGKITVWVDPPRVPAANAFKKAYPKVPINIVQINGTVGGQTVKQAFANFDAAGKGWPDAIFFPSNDDIAWAASPTSGYAADLTKLLARTIKGYNPAVLSQCVFAGQVRCLRNDVAADLFWYNKTFFTKYHYTVPTTWQQYADLAVKIATEHPGMISGFLGDAYAVNRYLQAAGCPTNVLVNPTTAHINLADPNCAKVQTLLDQMYKGKALSTDGVFDADAIKIASNLVMTPGAIWYGNYLLHDTWKLPAGQWTAAQPLAWTAGTPSSGDEGGGLWGMSSHIKGKQLANAVLFMKFVATDPRWQVALTTGLPGYGPDEPRWLKTLGTGAYAGFFADLPKLRKVMSSSLGFQKPYTYMVYDTGNAWTQTFAPTLIGGGTISSAFAKFGTELLNEAKAAGYTVQ